MSMNSFVEDYQVSKTAAVASAVEEAGRRNWSEQIDEDMIYAQIASPEFRLYMEIIF